ncbi:MAG: cell division protein FtsH, partial [Bacteroidetes bacterium CG_4_10_14_3_um_filter_42_6]
MAEENNNTTENKEENKGSKNPFSNLTGGGKNGDKPKFNFYWIYGILAVVLFGIQFLGMGDDGKQTDWREFKTMLEDGDVAKIILVNKETAEIFIKTENLTKDKYKDLSKGSPITG